MDKSPGKLFWAFSTMCKRQNANWQQCNIFHPPQRDPITQKVTYGRLVVDIRPLKEEKYRVRITVGGDKLHFCGDTSSVAASLVTVKLLLNGVVSTKGEKFTTADIKDFFMPIFCQTQNK